MGLKYSIGRGADGMTEKQREVVVGLGEKKSFSEIGKKLGISGQRAHQIASDLVKVGILSKTPNGYVITMPIGQMGEFTRLAAEHSRQEPTTPDAQSNEPTEEAH